MVQGTWIHRYRVKMEETFTVLFSLLLHILSNNNNPEASIKHGYPPSWKDGWKNAASF